jgi:hypothetical protein
VGGLFAAGLCLGILLLLSSAPAQGAATADDGGRALGGAAVWTGRPDNGTRPGACVAFRRRFNLDRLGKQEVMQVFADARYLLWVNGEYVERGPARFEPQAPEYDSVDITRRLRRGENVVAILVVARISNGKARMHAPGLMARVLRDGREVLASDAGWRWSEKTAYRAVTTDWPNMYDIMDFREEVGDWTLPGYDDREWKPAQPLSAGGWGGLTERRIPLLREAAVEPDWAEGSGLGKELRSGQAAAFKFKRVVLACTRLEVEAEPGTVLELSYAPGARITCRGGLQSYLSTDAHAIYEGAIRVRSGRAVLRHASFSERLYPFERLGCFDSSDLILNKLWTTSVRGLEVTSEDAYVDCTDRERVEWMDCDPPAFDVTRVAMAGRDREGRPVYADPRLLEEMLRRTAYTLQPEGWVKAHTCSDRFDIHAKMEDRSCDWVEGARRYYESCGKTGVIREIWPAIVAQMKYFLERRTSRGLVRAREWVVWGNPVGYQTCEGTALNAFVYRALADAAYLGRAIGETKQALEFERESASLKSAINAVLWDEAAGSYSGGYYELSRAREAQDYRPLNLKVAEGKIEPTRHAALFAWDQGVVPPERQASVRRFLMDHAPTDNSIMQYYYYFRFQYQADTAAQDEAVLAKLRAEWKDMAYNRYEAAFEGLHSWGSQAHCYGMFPAYYLSAYVLGVRVDGAASQKRLLIEPRLGALGFAAGTVVTEFGPVQVSWRKAGDEWRYGVDASGLRQGVEIHLRLPAGSDRGPASLDGKDLGEGRGGSSREGRWLDVRIKPGKHQGQWRNSPAPGGE